jgi:putative endonuclease
MTTKTAARPAPAKANPHHALGRRGEELAARYLESHGLVVLSRNWRCRDGELDLVLTDGNQVVVCEVKTRTDTSFGTPAEAVDEQKSKRIRRLAHKWLSTYRIPWCELRFDILSIIWPPQGPPIVQHIKGAF